MNATARCKTCSHPMGPRVSNGRKPSCGCACHFRYTPPPVNVNPDLAEQLELKRVEFQANLYSRLGHPPYLEDSEDFDIESIRARAVLTEEQLERTFLRRINSKHDHDSGE